MMLIGNAITVGNVGLSTAIGAPTVTTTPGGVPLKVRSEAETVLKLTGRLKVSVTVPGDSDVGRPLPGVAVSTRSELTAFRAAEALTRPKPPSGFQVPGAEP